jgi:phosphohistidine phosphatase SixA
MTITIPDHVRFRYRLLQSKSDNRQHSPVQAVAAGYIRRWEGRSPMIPKAVLSGSVCIPMLMTVAAMAGQTLSSEELAGRLRQGGYVLVMRHASSPREAPSKEVANADNTKLERQLDEAGRRNATAMGEAIRALRIPIGMVLTSPTYRAMETVRLARLDSPAAVNELGDGGQSMQGITESQAAWLRARVTEAPRAGNTILVTHQPNLSRAFPDWGPSVADGETVILRPDGKGGAAVLGRIPIEEWSRLR